MKHLKLFFALFAMLALGVGNAWGAEEETLACPKGTISNKSMKWSLTSCTILHEQAASTTAIAAYTPWRIYKNSTVTFTPNADITISKIVITVDNSKTDYVNATKNGTWSNASISMSGNIATVTPTDGTSSIKFTSSSAQTRWKSITITYEAGSSTPTTTYTIKWHTAKDVTTDVILNEGATITKPETDPTMTGYEFMGWTASCDVASDGSDFTALTDFGTADSDKDFYAVFAKATTTGGDTEEKEFTFNITKEDFNTTSYAANNNEKTSTAKASDGSTMDVKWTSNQVMQSSSVMQWQKDKGYIYNSTDLGTITNIEITSTAGTFTKYINNSKQPTSNGTGGYFQIKIGNATGKSSNVKVTFTQTVEGGGTTTYDNYITTCASGIEYIDLGDDFKWSATEAEVTIDATDNVFPTLTNTHNVPVKYSSSDDTFASIAADGTVTLKKEGTVTITAKYEGGTSAGTGKEYKAKTVTYSLKVNKAAPVASGTTYVKVTSTEGLTDGEYLIVYEAGNVAFDGSLEALDVVNNTVEAQISSNTIAGNQYIDAATFTIDIVNGTILSASGKYIGKTANNNGLDVKTTAMTNTFAIDANGNAVITGNTAALRYNKTADQKRFRYYKDGGGTQEKIALYKKASSHTLTYGTCTNGSVSANVADGATVLSGTTITLSNTPTTDYKLSAYDVYKTGGETTKVTVTNGKFIMPEFDVTISATFVPAKTLTSIEITSAATQTTFWQGETFNYTGLEVTAHFDGAADEVVTPTVTGSTATAGTQTVTVSFTEGTVTKTATYTITVKAIPNTKETAYSVADAYDIIDKLTTAEGVFISGIISQVDSYNSTYKSITYWISADGTTTKQLQVYSGKGLESADFSGKTDLSVGDQVIVCGNLKKYDGTYEFDKNNYLAVHTKTTKADPELSYTTTEYNVNLGDAFTAPTLNNPHTLAVTYSSNNEDVATVAADGAVTIKAAGTVTITASFAGNDTYVSGSASYTINITDPNVSEVTFLAGTDKSDDKSISKNGITVSFTDGTFSRDDNYRCYAGKEMTISYNDGVIIKIVLTKGSDSSKTPSNFTTTDGNYSYLDGVGTWTGEAKNVTFATSTQVQMKSITVYYKQDKRANSELTWSEESINLTVGDDFTAPTFKNPNNLAPISFISDNTALAIVNNAGVISLKAGAVGTATITAKYAGNETYKDAEVSCTITVNPKTEDVVIVAQREGKWYALKATTGSAANSLDAVEVEYINGVLYNVNEADKASITWKRTVVGNLETFQYGDKYLKGSSSTNLFMEEGAEGKYQWDKNAHTMLIGSTTRTFLYQGTYFKNYAISNAGKTVDGNTYSALPIVTAAKFENATVQTRDDLTVGNYGTICYENNITNYEGVTFYAVAGREGRKVIFDEVTELEAGMPYLFRAEAAKLKIAFGNETASEPGYYKSLQGTFTQINPAEENILTGNYVMYDNMIKKCGKNCGLKANRAYFIGSELEILGAPAHQVPGRKRVSMDVLGEDEATGVDNITENGVVAPALQGTYDVLGRQLIEPATTGFYIVNGKKVLVVK